MESNILESVTDIGCIICNDKGCYYYENIRGEYIFTPNMLEADILTGVEANQIVSKIKNNNKNLEIIYVKRYCIIEKI